MINIALIGCGRIAHQHVESLLQFPEVKIVALVDPAENQTRSLREKFSLQVHEFASTDALYAQADLKLDAVLIATTHTAHFAQTKEALERGLHVLLEKPMVTTSRDAYELWRIVNRSGRVFAVTYPSLYSPEYRCVIGMRDRGELGRPQMFNGWISQHWLAANRGKWRLEPELSGGGHLIDTGAHVLSSITWIMAAPVVQVACMINTCDTPVDVSAVAILRFADETVGSIAIGGNTPGWDAGMLLQTDTLQMKISPFGQSLEISRGRQKLYPPVEPIESPAGGTAVRNFILSILGKQSPLVPVRHGVVQSVVIDALHESARTGQFVSVPIVPAQI